MFCFFFCFFLFFFWLCSNKNQRDVNIQTEATRRVGTWQSLARTADRDGILKLVQECPAVLTDRGAVGETLCHLLLLFNTDKHCALARELITKYPELISDRYKKEPYTGENLLHIAIVNRNIEMVAWLVDREPALLLDKVQ